MRLLILLRLLLKAYNREYLASLSSNDNILIFVRKIVKCAYEIRDSRVLRSQKSKIDNLNFYLLIEIIFFYIHLTDRYGFGRWDEETRGGIMTRISNESLTIAIEKELKKNSAEAKEEVFKGCINKLRSAMEEYSKFKMYDADTHDKNREGEVFWEFSKKLSKLIGQYPNPGTILGINSIIIVSLKFLDVDSFIRHFTCR